MSSASLVATTEHDEPASPNVRIDPRTKHVPLETENETAPVPLPPEVASERPTPYVPDVVVSVNALCATRAMVSEALFLVSE